MSWLQVASAVAKGGILTDKLLAKRYCDTYIALEGLALGDPRGRDSIISGLAPARFAKLPAASWLKRRTAALRVQKETNTIWGARRVRAPASAAEQPTAADLRAVFLAQCVQKGWGFEGGGEGGGHPHTDSDVSKISVHAGARRSSSAGHGHVRVVSHAGVSRAGLEDGSLAGGRAQDIKATAMALRLQSAMRARIARQQTRALIYENLSVAAALQERDAAGCFYFGHAEGHAEAHHLAALRLQCAVRGRMARQVLSLLALLVHKYKY